MSTLKTLMIDGFGTGNLTIQAPTTQSIYQTGLDTLSGDRATKLGIDSCFTGIDTCAELEIAGGLLDMSLKQTAEGEVMGVLRYNFIPQPVDISTWDTINLFSPVGFDQEAVEKLDLSLTLIDVNGTVENLDYAIVGTDMIEFYLNSITTITPLVEIMEFRLFNKDNQDSKGIDATLDSIYFSQKSITEPSMLLALFIIGGIMLWNLIRLKKSGK